MPGGREATSDWSFLLPQRGRRHMIPVRLLRGRCLTGFLINPIGTLHTPWNTIAACPRNGRQPDPAPVCTASVRPEFVDGLGSLDGFSHLILLYWLGSAASPQLTFTPPFDPQPRGIFATRAPFRPTPIGLSVVAFDGFDGPGVLTVRYLDCMDGTPLLDIKPYLPTTDSEPAASMGWLGSHATRNRNTIG
jgi:tRNA-Thr(GGU) m(6)t(6)A37 methyltransferase TsaA